MAMAATTGPGTTATTTPIGRGTTAGTATTAAATTDNRRTRMRPFGCRPAPVDAPALFLSGRTHARGRSADRAKRAARRRHPASRACRDLSAHPEFLAAA